MTQLHMIDRAKLIAQEDENISAVLMYGSFTKNEGDNYSDIEFYIFLKNKEGFAGEKWVSQIHPVAMYFTNEYGSEVAIFENMVRGEFHFLTIDEMEIIKSWDGIVAFSDFEAMNLVDKEGLLTKMLNSINIKSPQRITKNNILWLSQSLLNVLLTTHNLIQRGELAHAHQSMAMVQKYLLWLIRIATKQTQHWESPTKSLEKDIDAYWYSEFESTISDLELDNIYRSFENSLRLSGKLFEKLNVDIKLKEILNRIKQGLL